MTNSIIENFEKNIGKGPLFEFCITIQNHGPYEDKYWELEQNFSTEEELSEEEIRMYSGYFQGIKDADRQIETLVDYFENSEEAVVLVFFGDHLPGFSNGMSYFSHFHPDIDLNGDPQQRLMAYETPFFIWANNAAKEITNFDERINTLPENNVISSFYLGALTMELIGMGSISPFFEYVNEMRKILPVASSYFVVYTDGTIAMNINKDELDIINKYKRWIYYKLFDE
ncbi:hypothetical protein IMSAG049_01198 [Clostridiales bacterium]|nr:hypothetical protein IMSAG049_01198 [Clostridiales bacterium]